EEAATQVVGRDRHAEFIGILANLAASLEKFCTEVRNLQRTEIGEVAEAFESRSQVGSSTMAQKENPVASENVCSLARIVRSLVTPALENVPLWHERDLTNSAAERILIPHACVLIDEMVAKTTEIFRTLRVFPDRMKANLPEPLSVVLGFRTGMQFARAVEVYEQIEGTTKRLEMTGLLVGLLRDTPPEDLDKVVYLTQGRIHPDYLGVELGLAEKMVIR